MTPVAAAAWAASPPQPEARGGSPSDKSGSSHEHFQKNIWIGSLFTFETSRGSFIPTCWGRTGIFLWRFLSWYNWQFLFLVVRSQVRVTPPATPAAVSLASAMARDGQQRQADIEPF